MTPLTFILVTIGVGYSASLLTRLIVWLDGADDADTQ